MARMLECMKPYSMDLRERLIAAYDAGLADFSKLIASLYPITAARFAWRGRL